MRGQSIEDFRDDEPEIENDPNRKRSVVPRPFMRMSGMIVFVRHRATKL